ncbi:MAG: 4'-phosphopantetheinyl transferase superfamily protein [Pseudomonadota bacterium]
MNALYPEEREGIRHAIASRLAEFTTGRMITRHLLSRFGYEGFPVLASEQRMPLWPSSCAGSISHSSALCAVAITGTNRMSSLGIDLEPVESLETDVRSIIATDDEQRQIDTIAAGSSQTPDPGVWLKLFFSIKESVYKSQYPLNGQMLNFLDVELQLSGHEFTAIINKPGVQPCRRLTGGWLVRQEHFLTWAFPTA